MQTIEEFITNIDTYCASRNFTEKGKRGYFTNLRTQLICKEELETTRSNWTTRKIAWVETKLEELKQ
jgi:hypothetical protein